MVNDILRKKPIESLSTWKEMKKSPKWGVFIKWIFSWQDSIISKHYQSIFIFVCHTKIELISLIVKHTVEPAPCDWDRPTCRVALHTANITNFTIPFVWTSTVHCRFIADIFLTPTEQPTTVLLAIQLWPWTSLRGGIVGGHAVSNSLFRYVASSSAHCHGARRKDFNRYRMTTAMTDCVSFRSATLRCRSVMSRALPIVLLSAIPARTLLHVLLILLNGVIAVCS